MDAVEFGYELLFFESSLPPVRVGSFWYSYLKITDKMFRKIKMLGNGFVFIFADITSVSVYSFSDAISSFSNIYTFGTEQTRE